jgi:hypothetical protein
MQRARRIAERTSRVIGAAVSRAYAPRGSSNFTTMTICGSSAGKSDAKFAT